MNIPGPPLFPNKPSLIPNKRHTRQIVNSFGGFVSTDNSGSSSTVLANVPSSATGLNFSDDPNGGDDVSVGINDLSYYSSVGDPQGQPGLKRISGLNFGSLIDYNKTQRQKEHVVQPQQYPTRITPGFMFGAINAYNYSLQQCHDSSISEIGFSFPTSGKEVVQGSLLGPDDYGLLGLLKTVKGANHDKTNLAMGVDPHSLVLELNYLEPLYPKFASPWSVEPAKEGTKYDIPDCYNSEQPLPLKQSLFKKFDLAMLFYIFYSMPQDQAQLFAANELNDRGWYFHRELRMWFTRDQNSVPAVRNATFEVGSYVCFDPSTWQTIRQDKFVLYYEMIEKRPAVPP
ncbi:probable NOT transcription complex subunit VIP2 [Henckelia pumila]|uniref:probable NOT transcription complex subunit VIP2 n=1 Tax=Henckelia pumila TaxID=405737 RepID=UPI003C6E3C56